MADFLVCTLHPSLAWPPLGQFEIPGEENPEWESVTRATPLEPVKS